MPSVVVFVFDKIVLKVDTTQRGLVVIFITT